MDIQLVMLRNIVYGASSHGANLDQLCREVGLSPKDMGDADQYITWDQVVQILHAATRMTHDPCLGLHVGYEANPTLLGILGHLLQSCSNWGEVLEALCKHGNAACPFIQYELAVAEQEIVFYFHLNPVLWHKNPQAVKHLLDFSMAGLMRLYPVLTGKNVYPLATQFHYPVHDHLAEYQRIFQSGIESEAEHTSIIFQKEDLEIPVLSSDQSLYSYLDYALSQKLQSLKRATDFSETVKHMLLWDFKGQCPPIEVAAAHLNMSLRTFQRSLASSNTNYRTLCNALKKELALPLISHSNFSVGEVAELMGYSDVNAFRRAFKNWTRQNPAEVRSQSE